MESLVAPTPVLVPFICPACTAPNAVALLALSRAGGMQCVACRRRLSPSDVSRAIHAPRTPKA